MILTKEMWPFVCPRISVLGWKPSEIELMLPLVDTEPMTLSVLDEMQNSLLN